MQSRLVLLTFLDGPSGNYPDNSLPGQPVYPSQGLPGGPVDPGFGVRPPVDPGYGQGHPFPGHPSHPIYHPPVYPGGGPVFPPVGPDNTLPDNSAPPTIQLPIVLPPQINPTPPARDQKFELKWSARYGWVLVPVGGGEIDNTLPQTPEPK
jgi:hypothetical protein